MVFFFSGVKPPAPTKPNTGAAFFLFFPILELFCLLSGGFHCKKANSFRIKKTTFRKKGLSKKKNKKNT